MCDTPFCVVIYSDHNKLADPHYFLKEFIQEISQLLLKDLTINGKVIHIKIALFVTLQSKNSSNAQLDTVDMEHAKDAKFTV